MFINQISTRYLSVQAQRISRTRGYCKRINPISSHATNDETTEKFQVINSVKCNEINHKKTELNGKIANLADWDNTSIVLAICSLGCSTFNPSVGLPLAAGAMALSVNGYFKRKSLNNELDELNNELDSLNKLDAHTEIFQSGGELKQTSLDEVKKTLSE